MSMNISQLEEDDPVAVVNRLYSEVVGSCGKTEVEMSKALVAAWSAGKLLYVLKQRVRRNSGHGAWEPWLEQNFRGSVRTAQRYIALAKSVTDVADFGGMSLRQAYMVLGLSVEKKGLHDPITMPRIPAHLRMANRFLATLPSMNKMGQLTEADKEMWRRDLRMVLERLRMIFGPDCVC
jgi:hypothetical protein